MQFVKRILLIVLVLTVLALAIIPVLGQDGGAKARFVHAIPGASAVDIYVNGQLAVSSLAFGGATDYIALPAGDHTLTVTQQGAADPLWTQNATFAAQSASTLIASSINPLMFTQYADDLNPLALGKARVTAIHAIADADPVDVVLSTGQPVIAALEYNQPYGTLDLPAASYDLAVVPVGDALENALINSASYSLVSGTSYVLVAYGTSADPQALVLTAPTDAEIEGGAVRFIHGFPAGGDVDIYVDDTLVVPSLAFGALTEFMALPTGSYTVTVRAAGEDTTVLEGALPLANGEYISAMVLGLSGEAYLVNSTERFDEVLNARQSALYVVNALTDISSVTASLEEGEGLLSDIAAGAPQLALLDAGTQDIILGVTTNAAAGVVPLELPGVYGGVVYTAIVKDGGEVTLDMFSVAQDLTSAPTAVEEAAVEPTVVVVEATPVPVEVAVQPTQPAATAAPVQVFPTATLPPQPTAAPTQFTGPTARILLDPGANLHLRQYPRADALSLGLAPSGTILAVVGRVGAPGPVPGIEPTPTTTPYVDPVTLLEDEDADLIPAETWLYVIFNTPDGGSITAWVNAQFLAISDEDGEEVPLRNLATVPSNRFGAASNTAIQPPSARQNPLTLTIVGVDPTANVHIRRTPTSEGESLARVPNGTVMDFLGLNEAQEWAYVRYRTADGGTVRGWVNTSFVTYQRSGQPVTIEELVTRAELVTVADEERGEIEVQPSSFSPSATPLRDTIVGEVVNLNAGANLHLRRRPNTTAESLALLPNGTSIIISGQATDAEGRVWLETTYQEQTGWVWSQYVRLSFNGRPFDLTQVPIVVTPTPTPSATPGA